jgi:hypothetical protein
VIRASWLERLAGLGYHSVEANKPSPTLSAEGWRRFAKIGRRGRMARTCLYSSSQNQKKDPPKAGLPN